MKLSDFLRLLSAICAAMLFVLLIFAPGPQYVAGGILIAYGSASFWVIIFAFTSMTLSGASWLAQLMGD